jgi:3-hydroxyisobutyrate dehydrogenase-like beta-hydroxyacid dehydrogenase
VHTTGSPQTAGILAARFGPKGVSVVDAPGSGGPSQAAAGELTLFVGGEVDAIERVTPMLRSYATRVVHVGPLGSGQQAKLLNNLLFGAHVELAVEAARLSEEFGLDPAVLAGALRGCSGSSYALDCVADMGSVGALLAKGGRFIHKDVRTARDLAGQMGVALGSFGAVTDPLLVRTRQG